MKQTMTYPHNIIFSYQEIQYYSSPYNLDKGGIEGPAGPANAVPLSEAVCNAGPLFYRDHTH